MGPYDRLISWSGADERNPAAGDVSGELLGDLRAEGREIGSLYTGTPDGFRVNMPLAWSAIPHHGYIFVSDINSGLFVARVTGGPVTP